MQTNTGRKKIVASFLTQTHESITEKYRKNETNNELIKNKLKQHMCHQTTVLEGYQISTVYTHACRQRTEWLWIQNAHFSVAFGFVYLCFVLLMRSYFEYAVRFFMCVGLVLGAGASTRTQISETRAAYAFSEWNYCYV